MNIVKDPGLAEEITQSTFFKAMTAKSDLKRNLRNTHGYVRSPRIFATTIFVKAKGFPIRPMTLKF